MTRQQKVTFLYLDKFSPVMLESMANLMPELSDF